MADCELLPACPFFNDKIPIDSIMGKVYKRKYCKGLNTRCARYTVFEALGREKVPLDLYPHMYDKAKMIISQK